MEKTCCFMGYRSIPADKLDEARRGLEREIGLALEDGYDIFITVFVESGDMLFARLVNERREDRPDLFLECIIPTPEHAKRYSVEEWELLSKSDGLRVLCEECQQDYTMNMLRYMTEQASRVIGFCSTEADSADLYAIDYARTMEKDMRIMNI